MPDNIAFDPNSYIQQLPGSPFKLPLWYYPKEREDRTPTLSQMEEDIERYVEANIGDCLGNYEEFQTQFDIEETASPTAEATIKEDRVEIALDYPLDVNEKGKDRVITLQDFIAETKVPNGEISTVPTCSNINSFGDLKHCKT